MLNTAKQSVKKAVEKIEAVHSKNPVTKIARTLFLAGIGTVAISREEIEAAIAKLVEKGEITEKESRKVISELFDRSKSDVTRVEDKVGTLLDERIGGMLATMNLPGKKDIDTLTRKISALSKKVAELDKKLSNESKQAA
ncbi:MAG: hypothetical protein GXP37_09795 [Chloroflexi bacterium]|nr:hypothetical protein [Chloroflexota bacterium]